MRTIISVETFRCECRITSETARHDRDRLNDPELRCKVRGTTIRAGRWVCRYHAEPINPDYIKPNMFREFEANFPKSDEGHA